MFTSAEQLTRLLEMEVVWSAEMDNVNRGIGGKFLERRIGLWQSKRCSGFLCALGRAAKNSLDGDSETAQGLQMGSAHKSKSDDCGVQFLHEFFLSTVSALRILVGDGRELKLFRLSGNREFYFAPGWNASMGSRKLSDQNTSREMTFVATF